MTLEFILWILAWLVVSEILFIIMYKRDWLYYIGWVAKKIYSLMLGFCFMLLQLAILCPSYLTEIPLVLHYERLLYEVAVIVVIGIYFRLNKLLVMFMDRK